LIKFDLYRFMRAGQGQLSFVVVFLGKIEILRKRAGIVSFLVEMRRSWL
jgi:hypothetical protein